MRKGKIEDNASMAYSSQAARLAALLDTMTQIGNLPE